MVQDYPAFRERSRMVFAQPWVTVRGTVVRSPGGRSETWLHLFTDHPVVGSITGWPREVLPVPQQPLCNLPVLAVATMLAVGAMWLYDRPLRRVILVTTGQLSMAVLVGSKQLARIQGDDAQGHITEVLLSVPDGDDNVAADARHTLGALGLGSVVEPRSGEQRILIASSRGPGVAGVDVIGEIVQDYGWELLTNGAQRLRVVRWPRLLESLSATSNMVSSRPGLHMRWGETKPASLCHCTCVDRRANSPPGGVQCCVAGPVVAALWRRLRPIKVGAPAAVLRVRRNGAGLGASMCLFPALWVV